MKAIIMAGGKGTRLYPLTSFLPKPLMPVVDRPLLQYTLAHLASAGIEEVALSLSYQSGKILDFLDNHGIANIVVHTYFESDPLGTAGGVKNSGGFLDETFLVVSGDALAFPHIEKIAAFHRRRKSLCTILTVARDNPREYGMISSGEDGRIRSFKEKPGTMAPGDRANTGIYMMEPEILDYIPQAAAFDFSKDLFPLLLGKGLPLYAMPLESYWRDIGNLRQYFCANQDLLGKKPRFIAKNAFVHPRAVIGKGTIIGDGAIVGPQVELEAAILWPNTIVWGKKKLKNVILAEDIMVHLPSGNKMI